MFGGRAWSPDAAADDANGMFRCDIPRGSYTSDMLGACLLFHNDCDMFWVEPRNRTIGLIGGQTPHPSTVLGACALSVEVTGLGGYDNMGACL